MIGQIFIKNLQIDFQSIKIISKIKEKFNLNSDIPTDFSGIPILNNQRAWFFGGGQDDIKNLWILFETALQFSEYPNDENRKKFCEIFDIVKQQRLIKWNITIGLFWFRPYSYLNLDSRNREYLEKAENEFKVIRNITDLKDVPNAEKYIEIIEECKQIFNMENSKFKNFVEFSDNAFFSNKKSNASFLKWFRPLLEALKKLGGSATPTEVRKKIIDDERLSEEEISEVRGKSEVNKFANELAFARNYLVYEGL